MVEGCRTLSDRCLTDIDVGRNDERQTKGLAVLSYDQDQLRTVLIEDDAKDELHNEMCS